MPIDRDKAGAAIDAFLRAIGRDPAGDPLLEGTGARVAAAFLDDLCEGYAVDARALLGAQTLPVGEGETGPDAVVVRDLAVTTTCPHHLMPAIGTADVAFAPGRVLVGIGAIGGVVDAYARRLTLQETLGREVVRAISEVLAPSWVAIRIVLLHTCMNARGERRTGARVETFAFEGEPLQRDVALRTLGRA